MIIITTDLNTKNAEDDEEGAANDDNITNRFEGRQERLDYQLKAWSSVDHSEGTKSSD